MGGYLPDSEDKMEKSSIVNHLVKTIYTASDKEYNQELEVLITRNNFLVDTPNGLAFRYQGVNYTNFSWATVSRPLHKELHSTMDTFLEKWEPYISEKAHVKNFIIQVANQCRTASGILLRFPKQAGGSGNSETILDTPEMSLIRKRILLEGI